MREQYGNIDPQIPNNYSGIDFYWDPYSQIRGLHLHQVRYYTWDNCSVVFPFVAIIYGATCWPIRFLLTPLVASAVWVPRGAAK